LKKFEFRLQTVLDMRRKVLEAKQLEMAKIVRELNKIIEARENLIKTEADSRYTLENKYMVGEIEITQISNYKGFLEQLLLEIRKADDKIIQIQNILKKKQLEVHEAYKQVKILEKLEEKQEKNFYTELEKFESKEIDDIAITRYERSK